MADDRPNEQYRVRMIDRPGVIYSCPEGIRWVHDIQQVIIVDENRGLTFTLQGIDAAVWSWLSLNLSYEKLIRFIAMSLAQPLANAEQTLRTMLGTWHDQGLLEAVEEHSNG